MLINSVLMCGQLDSINPEHYAELPHVCAMIAGLSQLPHRCSETFLPLKKIYSGCEPHSKLGGKMFWGL